ERGGRVERGGVERGGPVERGGSVPHGGPARRRNAAAVLLAVALLVAAAPKLARLDDLRRDQAFAAELVTDLQRVIAAGGGRDAILACGRPYVGNLRGPLLAYHLDVEKQRVQFEPTPPGSVFRSKLRRDSPLEPRADGFERRASTGRWELRVRCP
ncbi:MAG TPA: hypothetical protein VFZ00_03470, partial [Solirubrobacter sp.]|nr:hypothetical protein [Solirubrobacter sp.]